MERRWQCATPGERWELVQGDDRETLVWIAQEQGHWRSESGRWWLIEDEDIDAIHEGRRLDSPLAD